MKRFDSIDNEFKILLGTNAKENDLLVKIADSDDLWFHLVDDSSPHLVIFNNGADLTTQELRQCCELVKNHSKTRDCKKIQVGYIKCKYIKRTKTPGTVIVEKPPKIMSI